MSSSLMSGLPRRETCCHPVVCLQELAAAPLRERHLRDGPLAGRPDPDDVIAAVVELGQRHLQRDSVHRVAGEEVLAAAAGTCAAANGNEVERRADVAEEAVVALTREDLRAVVEVVDPRHRERVVARCRPRPDVVGRGQQPATDNTGRFPVDAA